MIIRQDDYAKTIVKINKSSQLGIWIQDQFLWEEGLVNHFYYFQSIFYKFQWWFSNLFNLRQVRREEYGFFKFHSTIYQLSFSIRKEILSLFKLFHLFK